MAMRSMRRMALVVAATTALSVLTPASRADDFTQEIKNKTERTTANDLTLFFNTENVRKVTATDPVGDPQGKKPKEAKGKGPFVYDVGELPVPVAPGSGLKINFTGDPGTRIDLTESYWTENNRQMVNGLASLGVPPDIFFADGAFARISNPGPVPLTYTGIQLYRDNDLANFGTPFFSSEITGELVTGLPSSLTLGAGDSTVLAFGQVARDGYQLVTMNIALLSAPDDTFFTASAAVIPEPGSLALTAAGLLALLAARAGRRRNPTS